jgi:hypothetical protein
MSKNNTQLAEQPKTNVPSFASISGGGKSCGRGRGVSYNSGTNGQSVSSMGHGMSRNSRISTQSESDVVVAKNALGGGGQLQSLLQVERQAIGSENNSSGDNEVLFIAKIDDESPVVLHNSQNLKSESGGQGLHSKMR